MQPGTPEGVDAPLLPKARFGFSSEVVMIADPNSIRAEALRALRTHVMAQHIDDGRRGLAVCAASLGVGATFVAVNLAIGLAQVGVKTLLIDGDMRQAQVNEYVEPSGEVFGIQQYLEGRDFSECVQYDVIENLSVMFAGGRAANAQELLATDRFSGLVNRCLRDFDLTIIDTPPANLCADARRISTVVGYSLIVAKRHFSLVDDVKVLSSQLIEDRAQILGTVLNEA